MADLGHDRGDQRYPEEIRHRLGLDFGFEPDRSEAAACRYLNANVVSEDDCQGDAIQRRNATTPTRATVPYG